ncbi:MAG: hypothetical protein V3R94_00745, partial [Acidobacteriota bacterium]
NSEKVGTKSVGIILPQVSTEDLTLSSIVLADRIDLLEETVQASPYGPAKVFPNVARVFEADQTLLLFYQLSNFQIDPSSRSGFLVSMAEIVSDTDKITGEELKIDNTNAENLDRLHLIHRFDLTGLSPGSYNLRLQVEDQISQQQVERKIPFQIAAAN